MWCPMRKITTSYKDGIGERVIEESFQECMGISCAWWDSNNQGCVIYSLRALGDLVKQV